VPRLRPLVGNLPLFWKLLVPFLVLLVLFGTVGTFLIVTSLTDRANQTLNRDLAERSLAARSSVHDRELYVLESATLAANVEGIADAVSRGDRSAATVLMQSVLALKTELVLVAVVDRGGNNLAQFSRTAPNAEPIADPPTSWADSLLVAPVLASPDESGAARLLGFGDRPIVALATSICSSSQGCNPVGAIVVAADAARVAMAARESSSPTASGGVALYGPDGRLVAASGPAPTSPRGEDRSAFVRRIGEVGGERVATLVSPLELQGEPAGQLAVWMPADPAFAEVRAAAKRVGVIVVAAMAGVVAVGAGLSRLLLGQVRPLVAATRLLESGDLSARVPVRGRDELGELAAGVNNMAAALELSHETLEARVQERTEEVERLLRERTDFFTAVSHEFRTPIAVILGQAEMLGDAAVERKVGWHRQTSAVVKDAALQLLDFVNDILEIAKVESGHIDLDIRAFNLDALLRGMRPMIERLADSGEVSATVRVPRRLPSVLADEGRIRQVVLDLVDNAVKYTPPGGRVDVSTAHVDGAIEISVADTGVGIPADEAARVFEPFYRVKATRTQKGQPSSGLGLALVKRLVEAQGGMVRFESEASVGTTFIVRLPVAGEADRRVVA
jgi:signal transduction histidine kinase